MIAKISYETIHGDVGLGADTVEFEYFETFEDILEWAKNSGGDGYHVVVNEGNRADFVRGGEMTLLETDATVAYIDGSKAHQRDTISAEFFSLDVPAAVFYASGDDGTVIAFSDGNHVDTVSGDGWYEDGEISIGRDNCHAFVQEFRSIADLISEDGDPDHAGYREALGCAYNCVNDEITELYPVNDEYPNPPREYAVRDYVHDHVDWSPKSLKNL